MSKLRAEGWFPFAEYKRQTVIQMAAPNQNYHFNYDFEKQVKNRLRSVSIILRLQVTYRMIVK